MKRIIAAASFVALGMGAVTANAQNLKGSDTLKQLTLDIVAACPAASTIVYQGGGSGGGENALAKNQQGVAPMSRFLAANAQLCGTGSGFTPQASYAKASTSVWTSCLSSRTPIPTRLIAIPVQTQIAPRPTAPLPVRRLAALARNGSTSSV